MINGCLPKHNSVYGGQVAVVKHGQTLEARLQVYNYAVMQVYAIEEVVAFWQVNKWGEAYDFSE